MSILVSSFVVGCLSNLFLVIGLTIFSFSSFVCWFAPVIFGTIIYSWIVGFLLLFVVCCSIFSLQLYLN
jgi:hypothetical protein